MICEAGQGQLKLVEEKLELWVMPILLLSSFSQRRLLQEGLIKFQIEPMHIPVSRPRGAHGRLTLPSYKQRIRISCTKLPFWTFLWCAQQVGFVGVSGREPERG